MMRNNKNSLFTISPLALFLLVLATACTARQSSDLRTFLLRTDTLDLEQLSGQVTGAVFSQLQGDPLMREGYPVLGRVEFTPDQTSSTVELMHCTPSQLLPASNSDCILLNDHGDFVRVQSIDWESAAVYMYRIYIAPRALLINVNPTRDFVALDVFLSEELDLWVPVDQAIHEAVTEVGARPFRP